MLKAKNYIEAKEHALSAKGVQHVDNCINTILHDWIELKTGVRSATLPQNWQNMIGAVKELSVMFEIMVKGSK